MIGGSHSEVVDVLDERERRRVGEIAARLALDGDHGARDAELLAALLRVDKECQQLVAQYAALRARLTELRMLLDSPLEGD